MKTMSSPGLPSAVDARGSGRTRAEKRLLRRLYASRAWRAGIVPLLACLALALGTNPAKAALVTFVTPTGSSGSDGPLAASADFTTSAGQLTVTLTNLLSSSVIRSAGQALSDISFTLSNAPGTLGATTAVGQQGNVSSTGLVTFVSGAPVRFLGQGPPPPGGTGTFSITGNTILMEAIGGGQPSQMIAPAIANGGTFTNVNAGFSNFSPYTIGPATFTLNLSGVTAATTVTAATFSFGTGPDTFIPGTSGPPPAVPEPTTLVLAVTAIPVGLGCWLRRRKRAAA